MDINNTDINNTELTLTDKAIEWLTLTQRPFKFNDFEGYMVALDKKVNTICIIGFDGSLQFIKKGKAELSDKDYYKIGMKLYKKGFIQLTVRPFPEYDRGFDRTKCLEPFIMNDNLFEQSEVESSECQGCEDVLE